MAMHSLNHFSSYVNQQINSLETINDHLAKANALIQVALHENFPEYPPQIIHDYLLVLSNIVEDACHDGEKALAFFAVTHEKVNSSSQLGEAK